MNWEEFKANVKNTDPEIGRDIAESEEIARIVAELITQRNNKGLSQRELAEICNMPQSSIARIENFKSSPRLDTLVRLSGTLGLKLTLTPIDN